MGAVQFFIFVFHVFVIPTQIPSPVPKLSGETNWGRITQSGLHFSIFGNPNWSATGTIQKDGSIVVNWINNADGRLAPGVYVLVDGVMVGRWGYFPACQIVNGVIEGPACSDQITKIKGRIN